MEFFLFFTTLLQRYEIKFPEGSAVPTTVPEVGLVNAPQQYNVVFTRRE